MPHKFTKPNFKLPLKNHSVGIADQELQNCSNGQEVQYWLKKISKIKSKIKKLEDTVLALDLAETRVNFI